MFFFTFLTSTKAKRIKIKRGIEIEERTFVSQKCVFGTAMCKKIDFQLYKSSWASYIKIKFQKTFLFVGLHRVFLKTKKKEQRNETNGVGCLITVFLLN